MSGKGVTELRKSAVSAGYETCSERLSPSSENSVRLGGANGISVGIDLFVVSVMVDSVTVNETDGMHPF